jgi:hypothetical protein
MNCVRIGAREDDPTKRRRDDELLVEKTEVPWEANESGGEHDARNGDQIAGRDPHVQETCKGPGSTGDAKNCNDRLRTSELDRARHLLDIAAKIADEGNVARTSRIGEHSLDRHRLALTRRTGDEDQPGPGQQRG